MDAEPAGRRGPRLSLLGDFQLACCEGPLQVGRPAQRLLAYLAVHRARPVQRATAAERLWCEADPRRAASSLRSTLSRLPRPHGRLLVATTSTHVRLAPEISVDWWSSEDSARAVSDAAPGGPGPAPGRTGGTPTWEAFTRELLPDWCEDWLLIEQESYRQIRLHALEAVSAALRDAGRYPEALLAGLAAVRSEPLRETAYRRLIEVHLAEGNAAEALRQFQTYRRLIASELGLPPSGALRRLIGPLLGRPVDFQANSQADSQADAATTG